MSAVGSELLGYTGAALRHLQGDADSIHDGKEAASGVNSIPSRMKNRVTLPLSIAIHPAGVTHEDKGTSSARSSPMAGSGCGSSTPLANSSPIHGVSGMDDNPLLPVPATVRLSSKKVREICSPYSADKKIPLASRRGNSKQVHANHLRVSHQSLRQGVLRTTQESALHQLDTSDDSIVVSVTEPSGENCKHGKQKLLEKLSIEQETHQVVVTPVIVNRPSSVNLDGHPKVGLARQSEVSRDDGGQNQRWGGKPAGVFAAEYRQGQPSGPTTTTHQRIVAGGVLPSPDVDLRVDVAGGNCHDDSQTEAMGTSNQSCTGRDNPCVGTTRDLEGHIRGQSMDVLKRLQTLEHLHRTCTVNSAKLLTKACDDVIQMAKKKDSCVRCSTRDHETTKLIKMADDSTQTTQEPLLMNVAPKQRLSMECLPVDKNKQPSNFSLVERTLPPIEQLEVVMKATQILDDVKRAHEALEAESALLERKHQRAGLGKRLLSQSQSGSTVDSDLKDKRKGTEDVLVHRPLMMEKETRKGNIKPTVKHKTNASAVQAKRPSEETHTYLQNKPIRAQLNAKAMRRGTTSITAPLSTRPPLYIQPTKLTIPPPPPPPPPPPSLLIAVPTMTPCDIHPPQTVAVPLFTPQAVPSHETPRQPHVSEESTQTCLSGAEKPGGAIATTAGYSSEMGTQVGGSGGSALSTSKNLVVTHLPLVNISTSEEQSMTPPEQGENGVNQEVSSQSWFAPATNGPVEASHLDNEPLEEVVICGQMGPSERLYSEPCFQVQVPGLLASVHQSGTVSLEELEQRLNEHVMSQAQEWIQQELCAQVMAKVSLPSDPTATMEPDASSNSCSTCSLHSDHSTAHDHSDTLLQWFVRTGVPIDSELVHKLVQEIVVERGLALGGDVDMVSHESPSEEEEFSYTPPTSRDGSLATLVPTPKPTPPPSPPPSPPPHEESSPIPPLTALVSTPNPTPPPTSPRLEQPIGLQDELVVTPQPTETGDISTAQTSVPSVRSQPSWHIQDGEECSRTPSLTPPLPLPLQLSLAATPQSITEEHPCDQAPPPQPLGMGESPATKEPSLSESASSSSCVAQTSDLHTSSSTSDIREISVGELIKHSVSHGPGVSLSEGEVLLSPGDARWQTFHTKMSGLFPAAERMAAAHRMPMLGLNEVGGASQHDNSEASSDSTHGMKAWSEGQAIRGHFSGFLSKINTSTPENSTRTPNHTDDDNDSTHPMTDTTFAEDVHTSLPALREPGQVILDHIVASHDAGQQRASHDAGQQRASHDAGQQRASHDAGQQRTSHDAGQPGVVSPGEVHKPIILNHSISLSECNLDSMTSASEGEVKLETRDGIDVIRVSRHSSMTLSESEALKQRKDKVVTGNQHITVSETDPLVSPAALQSNDDTNAPMAAGDSHSAYPIILVSARKTTS